MRFFSLAFLLCTASAAAQASFQVTDPVVIVDGQRTSVVGAPLTQAVFGTLLMEMPGWGTLNVSDAPFDGARRGGDFDRTRLALVVDGRSVRLRSQSPLLSTDGRVPAFVRLDRDASATREPEAIRAPVRLRLGGTLGRSDPPPADRRAPVVERPVVEPEAPPPPRPVPDPVPSGLQREIDVLRAERDALRNALAQAEQERDETRLRLDALRAEVDRLRRELASSTPDPSADRLRQERDALQREVERLRADLATLRAQPAPALPLPTNPTPVASERVSLPDFDTSRLLNEGQVQSRLRTVEYPAWAEASGLGGDVLVLFQTDASGAVVRTAVPRPIGGGLDALAEEIVRAMRFRPIRAYGQPTSLRSQVVVRFTP